MWGKVLLGNFAKTAVAWTVDSASSENAMNKENNKLHCKFCERPFSTKSTLGRHLDQRSGDERHPSAEIAQLRENVARRGEHRKPSEPSKVDKLKRQKISKNYNEKEDVRERNKERRRNRDERIKAQLQAFQWYIDKLSKPTKTEQTEASTARFPLLVARVLQPEQWAENNAYPGQEQLNHLVGKIDEIDNTDLTRLLEDFKIWDQEKPDTKQELWIKSVFSCVKTGLQGISIRELEDAKRIVELKQKEFMDSKSNEFLVGTD